ncbi:MAG: hypothetical protein HY602_03155 [Parcubacteria group bacterium]|nr:hypothetical protein [Parcubacteria group bacterium]
MKNYFLVSFLVVIFSTTTVLPAEISDTKPVFISMAKGFPLVDALPFNILKGKKWKARKDSRFTQLDFYADEPFHLRKIEIESCDSTLKSGTVTINDKVSYDFGGMGNKTGVVAPDPYKSEPNYPYWHNVNSIAIQFDENPSCLKAVRFYKDLLTQIPIITPDLVEGKVIGNNIQKSTISDDIMNLFDSRRESAWITDDQTGVPGILEFKKPVRIEKIKVLNGYQRSEKHYKAYGRVRMLKLSGENGYNDTLVLEDVTQPQDIILHKPFFGKKLVLSIKEIYRGSKYANLAISELRFNNGQNWFMLNPLPFIQTVMKDSQKQFMKSNVGRVLDRPLYFFEGIGPDEDERSRMAIFRIGSDGYFYLEFEDSLSIEEVVYQYALGNYVVEKGTDSILQFRLLGVLETQRYHRNGEPKEDPSEKVGIFQELLEIFKSGDQYFIMNKDREKDFHFEKIPMEITEVHYFEKGSL